MAIRNSHYNHGQSAKIGVLLTNLGTPDAPTKQALRPYLKEFLSDRRVVDVPKLLWWFILNGIILNTRPAKSAEAYKRVWTAEGSPLAHYTKLQSTALAQSLEKEWGEQIVVNWAMRYGNPSISTVLQKMFDQGVQKLVVLPLYPQFSAATTGSTFDALATDFMQRRWLPDLRFVGSYFDNAEYIAAIADSIESHWQHHARPQKLIFSYHGVPLRYLHEGDPYHCQCLKTSRMVAESLGLQEGEFLTTFQSRFGKEEWLRPYTDETMMALPQQGITNVQVICPGFSSDCLETIDEIGVENKHFFLDAGGEYFSYIPALNADSSHISLLGNIVRNNIKDWQLDPAELAGLRVQRFNSHEFNK